MRSKEAKLLSRKISFNLISFWIMFVVLITTAVFLVAAYYHAAKDSCIGDPVEYATEHKEDYPWDVVYAIELKAEDDPTNPYMR